MNAPCSGAPLTAPHVTTGGLCRWKPINKEGRHVGLDFYDLLIEGVYTQNAARQVNECISGCPILRRTRHTYLSARAGSSPSRRLRFLFRRNREVL
jgi:hypothetical protein